MRKTLSIFAMALLVLSVMPAIVSAVSIGSGVDVNINTEKFAPLVWMCDNRVVYDDATEPGRVSEDGQTLVERINNYAFEGEQVSWTVLVMDKNKIDQNIDVYATIGDSQGEGNDIEVNCKRVGGVEDHFTEYNGINPSCNAKIQEERLKNFDPNIMSYFDCKLTVETPESMQGEYWVTVEAQDGDGLMGTMDENEYWFFNPEIALGIDGDLTFNEVRPGTSAYSDTLLLTNDAESGSGVMLDMFISGTDFYDSSSSGARCPDTNQLSLGAFRYYATNGAYSTSNDAEVGRANGPGAATQPNRDKDAEGYVNIGYGTGFNNPSPFYDGFELIQAQHVKPYWVANTLAPGSDMSVTFKLDLPEPCNGDFDTGQIFFWGEAI